MDILEIIDDRGHYVDGRFAGELIKPFPCPDQRCTKSFNRKSDLQRHYRIHTNERPYVCNTCGKAFIQRSALTVHFRTHTGEKPHKCEYIGCGKCFSDSSSLARHRRIHTGKRPYGCHIGTCEKRFVRKTSLTKHQQKTHNIKKQTPETSTYFRDVVCSACDAADPEGSDTEIETAHGSPAPQKPTETLYNTAPLSRAHTPANLHPTYYGHHHQSHGAGPLTPHPSPSLDTSPQYHHHNHSHHPQQNPLYHHQIPQHTIPPPTPRSPPQIKQEHQPLRMTLSPPTPYHIATAQALQSSPGSMSSCSSVSTSAQSDYFCHAPGAPASALYPIDPYSVPLHIQQMAQMQLVGSQFQPPMVSQQQQQMDMETVVAQQQQQVPDAECWFEVQPYQHQQMLQQQQQMQEQQARYYGEPMPGMSVEEIQQQLQQQQQHPVKMESMGPGEVLMMGMPAGYC